MIKYYFIGVCQTVTKIFSIILYLTFMGFAHQANAEFTTEIVDAPGNVGTDAALALANDNTPHISYYDASNQNLKYAIKLSGSWQTSTIDSVGDVGRYSAIVVDTNGIPHISYYDATNQDLKYAVKSGTNWVVTTIDALGDVGKYTSISLDIINNPYISYYDDGNDFIKLIYREASFWNKTNGPNANITGGGTSLVVERSSATPIIAYFDFTVRDIKLAMFDRGAMFEPPIVNAQHWATETVMGIPGTSVTSLSLKLSGGGEPHIAYATMGASGVDLIYIGKNCIAGNCLTQVTQTNPTGEGTWGPFETIRSTNLATSFISISLGATIQASYYAGATGGANAGLQIASQASPGWSNSVVDTSADVGMYNSMQLDTTGDPHIAYYDATNQNLKYAYILRTECNDGIDNDNDGLIDTQDSDCSSALDTTEQAMVTACAKVRRVMSGPSVSQLRKSLHITLESSDDSTCSLDRVKLDLGSGNNMSRATGIYCIPNTNVWTGGGTSQITIALNPDLQVTEGVTECINDTFSLHLDSGQSAEARFNCASGTTELSAPFSIHQTIASPPNSMTSSEAWIGNCPLPDIDEDGIPNTEDNCINTPNSDQTNSDSDDWGDVCDNCPSVANSGQEDADGDGIGDACTPQCRDGVDNDGDGNIDYPQDTGCSSSEDNSENSRLNCLPYMGALQEVWYFYDPVNPQPLTMLPERKEKIVKKAKLEIYAQKQEIYRERLYNYMLCEFTGTGTEYIPIDPGNKYCLAEAVQGRPVKCPPVDCLIDGPDCMDPYQYHRISIPNEVLNEIALHTGPFVSNNVLKHNLGTLIKNNKIKIDKTVPARKRYFSKISLFTIIVFVLVIVGVGFVGGRYFRR